MTRFHWVGRVWCACGAVLVMLALSTNAAWAQAPAQVQSQGPTQVPGQAQSPLPSQRRDASYEEVLARYLQSARSPAATAKSADTSWAAGLFTDLRARHVNDLVTVRVVENITASGSADSALDKSSSGGGSVTKLFGLENKFPGWLDPTSLAAISANTGFKGSGSTTRTGSLSAVITTRVVEVLPNGDLVLEGIREVDINGDRQFIVLNGIVRTSDIGPGNVVPSTAVGQMQIRYFGQGLIKDNLKPGWVVRILNKVF